MTASKKHHLARQAQLFTRKSGPFYPDFSWSYSTIPALILGHYFAPKARGGRDLNSNRGLILALTGETYEPTFPPQLIPPMALSKTSSSLIIALLLWLAGPAQTPDTWGPEWTLSLTRPLGTAGLVGFHAGGILAGAKPERRQRIGLDWLVRTYPQAFYQLADPLVLLQDSGGVQTFLLSYGREGRHAANDQLMLTYGLEVGLGYTLINRLTRRWPTGNLAQEPQLIPEQRENWLGTFSPFAGGTVWLDPHIGLMGQWWFRSLITRLGTGSRRVSFQYESRFEVRVGLVYRFTKRGEAAYAPGRSTR
jgi:hypothetical protein